MNKESADIGFGSAGELRALGRNVSDAPNKKTIEGIYCGVCLENNVQTLYLAYAAYGAPGKRIEVIKPAAPAEDEMIEELLG